MRILLLTTHVNLGGIGIYVLSLASGLVQRGHQVFVASCGGDLVTCLEASGVRHIAINIKTKSAISPKVLLARRQLIQIAKAENLEIIHAHTRVSQVLAQLVAKAANIPYVTTCHGFFRPHLFRRLLPCWGNSCIAISEAVREHLVNDLGVEKDRIAVVHNGVEIKKFSPDNFTQEQKDRVKNNYGLRHQDPIVGTVARLSSIKGQRYLILAMKEILAAGPQTQLLLVGDGPEKDRLVNQVKELGIEKNVFFMPATLDTSVPLSIMDIFAFPSILEGLGLAIIEAQAMGLPVVASDVGGIYTLVKDGINGFLVRPKDPGALAEAILKLVKNKDLSCKFGRQGREQAVREFNLEQMVSGIEQVYKGVLAK